MLFRVFFTFYFTVAVGWYVRWVKADTLAVRDALYESASDFEVPEGVLALVASFFMALSVFVAVPLDALIWPVNVIWPVNEYRRRRAHVAPATLPPPEDPPELP